MSAQHLPSERDGAARYVVAVRRMFKEAITAEFLLNPAIDMLLAVYLERDGDRAMSRRDVCAHTGVSEDVCRHWGLALAQRGLIVVEGDRYRLGDEGRRVMDEINDQVRLLARQHLGPN